MTTNSSTSKSGTNLSVAQQGVNSEKNSWRVLQTQQKLPQSGWSNFQISRILSHYASLDSNNQVNHIGIGEREGRIACSLVEERHYGMVHGIGRSGVLDALQPKAEGSSSLYRLTNSLVNHALILSGLTNIKSIVLPVATGMALSLTFSAIHQFRPSTKYVLIPRIDQRTCIKCSFSSGLVPVVVPLKYQGGIVCTDTHLLEQTVNSLGIQNITAIMSVTSCFAPRVPDDIEFIGMLCKKLDIFHVINNAYGMTSSMIMKRISNMITNSTKYRVDAIIQSTDKNLMVPVGGSVVTVPVYKTKNKNKNMGQKLNSSPNTSLGVESEPHYNDSRQYAKYPMGQKFLELIASMWAGRASISPILDVFISLLHFGKAGIFDLTRSREQMYSLFVEKMKLMVSKLNFEILKSNVNMILKLVAIPKDDSKSLPISDSHSISKASRSGKVISESESENLNSTNLSVTDASSRKAKADRLYNPISFALLFQALESPHNGTGGTSEPPNAQSLANQQKKIKEYISMLGSKLFLRQVTGHRLCVPNTTKNIASLDFTSWGCHYDKYPYIYLTMAAAPGIRVADIDSFCFRLEKVLEKTISQIVELSIEKIDVSETSDIQ